ncbi:MAG: hypothetical protein V4691_07755 [Pseudomonadota bacterium]
MSYFPCYFRSWYNFGSIQKPDFQPVLLKKYGTLEKNGERLELFKLKSPDEKLVPDTKADKIFKGNTKADATLARRLDFDNDGKADFGFLSFSPCNDPAVAPQGLFASRGLNQEFLDENRVQEVVRKYGIVLDEKRAGSKELDVNGDGLMDRISVYYSPMDHGAWKAVVAYAALAEEPVVKQL